MSWFSNWFDNWLAATPYVVLVPVALWLSIAPISPEPHLLEKIGMLTEGTLTKPVDIFDLFLHLTPLLVLGRKLVKDYVV